MSTVYSRLAEALADDRTVHAGRNNYHRTVHGTYGLF